MKEIIEVIPIEFRNAEFDEFRKKISDKVQSQSKGEQAEIEQISLKLRMEDYLSRDSDALISWGSFILDFLKRVGIRQSKLATTLDLRASNLNKILKGERRLNMLLAVKIASVLDLDPSLLIQIQAKNELAQIRKGQQIKIDSYKDLLNK